MSQLDISISFNHFFSLLICFYFLIHFTIFIIIKYWYNYNLRSLSIVKSFENLENFDNTIYLKRILKI